VEILLVPLKPTWINVRSSRDGIAKGLDHFLIHKNLVERINIFHLWVVPVEMSDHDLILLHWCGDGASQALPFKFNHSRL